VGASFDDKTMAPPIAQFDPRHKSATRAAVAVARAGRGARGTLAASSPGRVIAVFRRSFYAETGSGLACVGPLALGEGPLNALCDLPEAHDWRPLGIAEGGTIDCRNFFDLGATVTWRPRPITAIPDRTGIRTRLDRLRPIARTYARGDGLAPLVENPRHSDGLVTRAARGPIDDLESWLANGVSGETRLPPRSVLSLLGLGPGLTPSGDDYLGGMMVALRALGRDDRAAALATRVLPEAPTRTSRISAAHLSCAAEGEGAAALHDAIAALVGASEDSIDVCLAAIDAIGHSSGWDALAGALAVLRACAA
jgi:hypothetical protein